MIVSLLVMSVGVVLSVKAVQGASPIASLPNVVSQATGLSLGMTLFIVYSMCIILEWALIRDRKCILMTLSQLPFTLIFSMFVDLVEMLVDPWVVTGLLEQWALVVLSTAIIGFGIVLEVDANVSMLADDGLVLAIHQVTRIRLDKVMWVFDIVFVASAFIISYLVFHDFVGVGLGTIFAAITLGLFVRLFTKVVKGYIRKDGNIDDRRCHVPDACVRGSEGQVYQRYLHHRSMSILYRYGSTYYINMTNRCPCRCVFCVRNSTPRLGDADSLWLDREPTVDEVMDELRKVDLSGSREVVFCGYGEPTERFDDVLECAKRIKAEFGKPVRLDTNGLGSLINGRDIVPEMEGVIDSVSISLNAPNSEEYQEVSRPSFGAEAYPAILEFIRECRERISGVTVSVVGGSISQESEDECARMAREMNVRFRVR